MMTLNLKVTKVFFLEHVYGRWEKCGLVLKVQRKCHEEYQHVLRLVSDFYWKMEGILGELYISVVLWVGPLVDLLGKRKGDGWKKVERKEREVREFCSGESLSKTIKGEESILFGRREVRGAEALLKSEERKQGSESRRHVRSSTTKGDVVVIRWDIIPNLKISPWSSTHDFVLDPFTHVFFLSSSYPSSISCSFNVTKPRIFSLYFHSLKLTKS